MKTLVEQTAEYLSSVDLDATHADTTNNRVLNTERVIWPDVRHQHWCQQINRVYKYLVKQETKHRWIYISTMPVYLMMSGQLFRQSKSLIPDRRILWLLKAYVMCAKTDLKKSHNGNALENQHFHNDHHTGQSRQQTRHHPYLSHFPLSWYIDKSSNPRRWCIKIVAFHYQTPYKQSSNSIGVFFKAVW